MSAVGPAFVKRPGVLLGKGRCEALDRCVSAGEVVVAGELEGPNGSVSMPAAGVVAGMLERRGVTVHLGMVVTGAKRQAAKGRAGGGALALAPDVDPVFLAGIADDPPLAVVHMVTGHAGGDPDSDARTASRQRVADAFPVVAGLVDGWTEAVRPRRVLLCAPRASCAGVERAIEVVELALERYGAPIYVRRQIVHNAHVVSVLEARGVVFVDEVDEVPVGATVVFSAHGVSPQVRERAKLRRLRVIDATCPLVSKVHAEARRFAGDGYTVLLIGHDGHDEVEGTRGEAPESIRLVEDAGDASTVDVGDPDRVAYLTQTTLAVDETTEIVDTLRERFPRLVAPRSDDICYATQNRQDTVKAIAPECDLLLVVGSPNSSNSQRLVEVAERQGCPSRLIDDERDIELGWLAEAETVGLTAGASAPEAVVQRVLRALAALGPTTVEARPLKTEDVHFKLPVELR